MKNFSKMNPFKGLRYIDVFVGLNGIFLLFMCCFVYFERFIEYRGVGNSHEFFVYAVIIFSAIIMLWRGFRGLSFRVMTLVLLQIGIFMHFAGGLSPVDGGRLYDAYVLGIRYDKYVHFVNSFAVAVLVSHLFDELKINFLIIRNLVIVLTVLGLGAVVEIVEYIVMLTIEDSGVGGYHNNMQDLVANLFGGIFFIVVVTFRIQEKVRAARKAATKTIGQTVVKY